MGKGQSPTPNELKFVYELLAEGFSDVDILAKYDELNKHGKLGSLPYREDVRFIRQRRKEYESARRVLEHTFKEQTDPSLVKAQEEHFAEIRNLIEQWLLALPEGVPLSNSNKTTSITYNSLPSEINKFKGALLYDCLHEHLKDAILWQKYSAWEAMYAQYIECCFRLRGDIRQQERAWSNKAQISNDFKVPLLSQISMKMIDNELDISFKIKGDSLVCEHSPLNPLFIEAIGVTIEETTILQAENPEYFIGEYQNLGALLMRSQLLSDMVALFGKLSGVNEQIRNILQEMLVRREYIHYKCRLCPSQPVSTSEHHLK